jgi:hypothetical protein
MKKFTKNLSQKWVLGIAASVIFLNACKKPVDTVDPGNNGGNNNTAVTGKAVETYTNEVSTKWTDLELKLIRTTAGFTPPIAARALSYTNLATYESIVPGMTGYQTLVGQLQGLPALPKAPAGEYNWALAANSAKQTIIKGIFANASTANVATVDSLKMALENTFKGTSTAEVITRSNKFGQDIANAIFAYSKTDGGHEGYKNVFPADYNLPISASAWIPTSAQKIPMLPFWGNNRFFVAKNRNENPAPPKPFSYEPTSAFFKEAEVVYETSKTLTAEQKAIATFWADGSGTITPPGHYINLASIALKKDNANLAKTAEVYAKMGLALSDAFTSCWKCKYTYNLMRPVSYINNAIDPRWKTFIATPPFPEYTSGHSSGSGAAATILAAAFGENYAIVDNTNSPARSFTTFTQLSDEAAMSRLYGGIHFPMGNDEGKKNGRKIGANIQALKFKK